MNCDDTFEFLTQKEQPNFSQQQQELLNEHLMQCSECQLLAQVYAKNNATTNHSLKDDFWEGFNKKLQSELRHTETKQDWFRRISLMYLPCPFTVIGVKGMAKLVLLGIVVVTLSAFFSREAKVSKDLSHSTNYSMIKDSTGLSIYQVELP